MLTRSAPGSFMCLVVVTALGLSACTTGVDGAREGSAGEGSAGQDVLPASDAANQEGRDVPPGDPVATVTRAELQAALEKVPGEVERVLEESGVPGATVTVVHDDEVVYAEGFGVRNVDSGEAVDASTVFQLASLSKPISATVVSALVGRGELDWDDPVIRYDPDFALSDPLVSDRVTVADLFSHRSGLPDHAGDLLEDLGYARAEILARLALQPLSQFRNHYAYTNFGLTEGAVAAATAAGGTWEEITDRVLFDPAGMDHTTDSFEEFMAEQNRASPHVRDGDGDWVVGDQRDPQAQAPAGGVSSNAEDLGTWMRIQLADGELDGQEIVAPDALMAMRTPQSLSTPPRSPSARSSFYGYGLGVGDRDDGFVSLSHSGAFVMGAATAVGILPGQDLGVAVMTNGQPVGAPEALREIIIDLVVDGEVTKDWLALYEGAMSGLYEPTTATDWTATVEDPAPAAPATTYVGIYANPYYGTLEVREGAEGLEMLLGPEAMVFPLTPYDGDSFLFTPPGENSLGPTGLTFEVTDGVAVSANSEFYDESGLGTWTRT